VVCVFFFQAEDGIRDFHVTGVQTCALPICVCADRRVRSFLDIGKGVGPKYQAGDGNECYDKSRTCLHRKSSKADTASSMSRAQRSEERRVGKECRSRWERDE